jgi:hypothetical protein
MVSSRESSRMWWMCGSKLAGDGRWRRALEMQMPRANSTAKMQVRNRATCNTTASCLSTTPRALLRPPAARHAYDPTPFIVHRIRSISATLPDSPHPPSGWPVVDAAVCGRFTYTTPHASCLGARNSASNSAAVTFAACDHYRSLPPL